MPALVHVQQMHARMNECVRELVGTCVPARHCVRCGHEDSGCDERN